MHSSLALLSIFVIIGVTVSWDEYYANYRSVIFQQSICIYKCGFNTGKEAISSSTNKKRRRVGRLNKVMYRLQTPLPTDQ